MAYSSYALQYSNVDVQEVLASNVGLFITEGGPQTNFANSKITEAELVALQANGTQVVGYINVSVTDDTRPYWNASWTDDGTDTGIPTSSAPAWLTDQPSNDFGYVVDYTDAGWQDVVIAQAVDLVSSGFDGVFMDDFQQYYVDGSTGLTISENATAMMEFAVKIDDAIKAVNPDAVLISNGNPYVVTDGVGGVTSIEAAKYLEAMDGMLLEIFFGITQTEEAAIEQAKTFILPSTDVLALEYGGTDYQNYLFEQAAANAGFLSFAASDASYSDFGTSADATSVDDILLGTGLGDYIAAYEGNDTLNGALGDDTLLGGSGNDTLYGDADNDFLYGGRGDDTVSGGAGDDKVKGNLDNDTLMGGAGSDDLRGGDLNDKLDGGADQDFLFGENGNDVLFGGSGDDSLSGGSGGGVLDSVMDTFVYADTLAGGGGFDRIKDWEDGIDKIDLSAFSFGDFNADVLPIASSAATGADIRINFGGGDVLYIENFSVADFDASDVVLI